jgi:hypothetical protein
MTEPGLQGLVSYLTGIYRTTFKPATVSVWREQFRPYSDTAVMGAARAWVSSGEAQVPNGAVLTARAREQGAPARAGPPTDADLRREFPKGATLLRGHSRYPRQEGEALGDYLWHLLAWLDAPDGA